MNVVENIVLERVEKNKNIFTKEEMNVILNNVNLIEKVYFLGALDVQ